jgi:cell division protein FtsI (penicillin-binding protein 3)
VLGFTDAEGHGVTGVEGAFDKQLTDKATRGEPLTLSIDSRVQGVLESELGNAVTNLEAIGGAGIILDVHTGEVLAMTSLPTYNPNKLIAGDMAARRNAVTYNLYELGSVIKPLSIGAAIDSGVVTSMAKRYDATKPLAIAGFHIRDSHMMGRWLNVPETLIHSSNIVTAQIADQLGKEKMEAMFRSIEFNKRPAIELKERAFPLWPREWGRLSTMTTSYGHGIAVTPLHLANAYAALVNGGIWRPATIVKLGDKAPPQGHRVFKASTSARMRQLLRLIVSDGTGRQADAPGFRVGGKTGSAEKPGAGGYRRHSLVSTFAAVFPMDNPRYVVIAMIDEPKGNAFSSGQRTAGYTVAPVVKKVVMRAGPMLGVFPDESRDVDVSELTPLLWKNGESE